MVSKSFWISCQNLNMNWASWKAHRVPGYLEETMVFELSGKFRSILVDGAKWQSSPVKIKTKNLWVKHKVSKSALLIHYHFRLLLACYETFRTSNILQKVAFLLRFIKFVSFPSSCLILTFQKLVTSALGITVACNFGWHLVSTLFLLSDSQNETAELIFFIQIFTIICIYLDRYHTKKLPNKFTIDAIPLITLIYSSRILY